jgi:hypothetical protein
MTGARVSLWTAACCVIAGCGSTAVVTSTAVTTASTSTTLVGNTTQGTPTPAVTESFSCAAQSGGDATLAAQLTDVRTAHHVGFDRLTFEFAPPGSGGAPGIPAYTVSSRPSTRFTQDASGKQLTLDGSASLFVVAHNASGWDNLGPVLRQTYKGSLDQRPGLAAIREVAEVGDFERLLTWGVGLSSAACFHVSEVSSPARVVIDVQTTG